MTLASRLTRCPRPFDPALGAEARALVGHQGAVGDLVAGAAGSSPYLFGLVQREAAWLSDALSVQPESALDAEIAAMTGEAPALRRAKGRVALLLALADLGGVLPLEAVTGTLTRLADRAVDQALRALVTQELRRGRLPGLGPDDEPGNVGLVALAMGKMGAHELNYSSDIDLIVLFDSDRFDADAAPEARASFVRVTRGMTALLSDLTADGYVFRTDLRLRPDAAVTPVCLSMDAAESYYESVGRTWERAAYIKARAAAGDIAAGERFLSRLTPFVWRRHLDFAAIQDAHDMRLRIREHKGLRAGAPLAGYDIKLAPGGIREIEFFTQTRQLISGGRDADLRVRGTVEGLAKLAARGWVPQDIADRLTADYRAHREVEHRLQMVHDAQTQSLPTSAEGFERIACLMGTTTEALRHDLTERIGRVAALAEGFFAPRSASRDVPQMSDFARKVVAGWQNYAALRSPRAVEIFERLRPELLARLSRAAHPDEALVHLDAFLSRLPAGVQIFSLFDSNPVLIDLIIDIAATAPALAAYLGKNAGVLDAVIGGAFFADWPGKSALRDRLGAVMDGARDYEAALNAARVWMKEWHFRVGVHHLRGLIDAESAGRAYAELAEAVLSALWPRVVADFATRHGPPPGEGAVVLGMGSLGAGWLTSGSDLDLIVIYDPGSAESSTGARPLSVRPYYARLTQALVTALSAQMPQGRLYEVDMRLRPSGRQGPVATAIRSFESYQITEAWTWEHLALTRARAVAGDAGMGERVEAFRRRLLASPRDRAKVIADVSDMRARIAAAKGTAALWDLKAGPGGVQDIELVAQAGALLHGSAVHDTAGQIVAGAAAGWLTGAEAAALGHSFRLLQRLRTALRLLSDRVADPETLGAGAVALLSREADGADPGLAIAETRESAAAAIDAALARGA